MARYKTLRSAIHNHAHSFLSMMNWADGNYFVDVLARTARGAQVREVEIDWLSGHVTPGTVAIPTVRSAVAHYQAWLRSHFESMSTSPDLLRSLVMRLRLDFGKLPPEPTLTCVMEAEDDRGRRYTIPVKPAQPYEAV
jgi:hypothetical protein